MDRRLLQWGVLAPVGFVIAVLILSYMTPGYSHIFNTISELGETGAPYATTTSTIFIITGLMLAVFGYGFYSLLDEKGAGKLSGVFIMAYALFDFVGSGVFPVDPGGAADTTVAGLHVTLTVLGELSALAMPIAFLMDTDRVRGWEGLRRISKVIGILLIPASAYLIQNIERNIPGLNNTPIGLAQRLTIALFLAWITAAGLDAQKISL